MKNIIISRRYAKALFQLAADSKSLNDVLQALSNICEALKTSPELKKVLMNPLLKPDEIQSLVRVVTSNKLVLKSVQLLAKRKRLNLISSIFTDLTRLSDESTGTKRVIVKTPHDISDFDKRLIEKHLAAFWGGNVIGDFKVARDMVGGIWMQMGDKVMDLTLKRRFEDLRQYLINSGN